jgi:hypothetical protein
VTITTVGYGDFTAAGGLGRALASLEALLGQVYLVTVVATIVGGMTRTRAAHDQTLTPVGEQSLPPGT